MSEVLTIRLFGMFEARLGGESLVGLHLRGGERLLAFLALHSGVPHTYRALAQLFWPSEAQQNDDYDGGSFPRTRQAIYALRRALGAQAWRLGNPGKGVLCFDLTDADVDLFEFERLVQREDVAAWQRALELHSVPLLNTWNDPWIKEARTRCLRSYARIQSRIPAAMLVQPLEAPAQSLMQACTQLEAIGGAVPLASPFYIERETDREFSKAVARQDSIVLVKGARQIGKTSLLARGLQQARKAGARLLLTDFQSLSEADLTSAEALYRALAQDVADQLDLETRPEDVWNARRSGSRNLERYLCDVALESTSESTSKALVWGLDEIDRLFGYPCANEVFGLFRSWHNRRALDPDGPWSRLTLTIAYATEAHLFITDQNQSPFNVGTRLALSDFTREQVAELNRRHGSPLRSEAELDNFYRLVGGHPYLVRCGLAALTESAVTLTGLQTQALQEEGPFGDHLLRLRVALQKSPELTQSMSELLRGTPINPMENFYRLRSAGYVVGDGKKEGRPRCQLYAMYLTHYLLSAQP